MRLSGIDVGNLQELRAPFITAFAITGFVLITRFLPICDLANFWCVCNMMVRILPVGNVIGQTTRRWIAGIKSGSIVMDWATRRVNALDLCTVVSAKVAST